MMNEVDEKKLWFDKKLQMFLETPEDLSWARSMVMYTPSIGGKRFRPVLMLTLGEDLGVDKESLIWPAIAVEILHAASLIHDDLPAIDDDDYRRGKPSCHKVFGEGEAIVVGDILFFKAFEALVPLIREFPGLNALFVEAALNLGYGELSDIDFESREVTLDEILKMYERKTGALLGFCLSAPGELAGLEHIEVEKLKRCGQELGIAYQIYDDVKDVMGSFEELGKTPGKDEKQGKKTVPSIIGIDEAMKMGDEIFERVMKTLGEEFSAWKTVNFLRSMRPTLKKK